MDATCKTCPFFEPTLGDAAEGLCCRNPPTEDGDGDAKWPAVYPNASNDWCGEHPLRQRDRLAAMAMQGILACNLHVPNGPDPAEFLADQAYRIADAMLAATARPPEGKEPTP